MHDGTKVLGQIANDEEIPNSKTSEFPDGKHRLQLKVGNRDLYGLDFRWIDEDQIAAQSKPQEVVSIERQEWGMFFGRIFVPFKQGRNVLATGSEESWQRLLIASGSCE